MSAQDERAALTGSPTIYFQARRLLRQSPERLPPARGYRFPEPSRTGGATAPDEPVLGRDAAVAAVRSALTPLPADAATLHRRLAALALPNRQLWVIRSAVQALPLPEAEHAHARALARQLIRIGTTVTAVGVGLALLGRVGEWGDRTSIAIFGVFSQFSGLAVAALDRIDHAGASATWLAATRHQPELGPLVWAVRFDGPAAVRAQVLALAVTPRLVGSETAQRIAAAARLPELLDRYPDDAELLARAARLLVRMGCTRDYRADPIAYPDACALYDRVVTRAALLPASLAHHATLLALALDLGSGSGVLLDWAPGEREALLERLGTLLAESRWVAAVEAGVDSPDPDRRRWAGWIRRTGRRPFELPRSAQRLRFEVVVGEPVDREPVEVRILLDGRPLVPEAFGLGPANAPEYLLDQGLLRAEPEPREVQLAEAYCTEGCCGALHVTIRREGDEVVWDNWRRPARHPHRPATGDELPAYRFDAAAYDAELDRVTADRSWSWPARTTARLIRAGLAERPEVLLRWEARAGWVTSGHEDPDTVVVTFWHLPGLLPDDQRLLSDGLQFWWEVPDDGRPPQEQAASVLRRLAEEDPRQYATFCGGNGALAQELGYPWPPRRP
ncbi:hypothetical protein ACFW1A_09205 [Kitasatospora sp. NPDC058965]|uniref:hypothetical protein n=1 Tax=Kitasatospora sp. NPDC058965 TaxID=3346682 RepID=UPI0036B8D36A